MSVISLKTREDFSNLLQNNRCVAVAFCADWCGPCKVMSPIFEAHAKEKSLQISFAKVDVDAMPEVAALYKVASIPTFLFIKDGQVADKVPGCAPQVFKVAIERFMHSIAAPELVHR